MGNAERRGDDKTNYGWRAFGQQPERATNANGPLNLTGFLVPVDRQSDEGDGDDPEYDVFCAILLFLFCHKVQYSIHETMVQVLI